MSRGVCRTPACAVHFRSTSDVDCKSCGGLHVRARCTLDASPSTRSRCVLHLRVRVRCPGQKRVCWATAGVLARVLRKGQLQRGKTFIVQKGKNTSVRRNRWESGVCVSVSVCLCVCVRVYIYLGLLSLERLNVSHDACGSVVMMPSFWMGRGPPATRCGFTLSSMRCALARPPP